MKEMKQILVRKSQKSRNTQDVRGCEIRTPEIGKLKMKEIARTETG